MQLQDYYSILELPPSATHEEIKKAYRRLAHQYHPDKKGNDPYAAAQFAVIKEAYETLMSPAKRDYYLQQRWYAKSQGRFRAEGVVTPVSVLKKLLELDRYGATLDLHRTDHAALTGYLNEILSPDTITTLNQFNEPAVNTEIVKVSLKIIRRVPYTHSIPFQTLLKKINADTAIHQEIDPQFQRERQAAFWEKQRIWIVILVVMIICLLIITVRR